MRHRNLPLLLWQAREKIVSRFRALLHLHGLTEQRWRIIRALMETGPLQPKTIGLVSGISSPSLTGVLVRMEDDGLIQRVRCEQDQRRLRVSLTPASHALGTRMAPEVDAIYAAMENQLGVVRMRDLYDRVDELLEILASREPVPSASGIQRIPARRD